MFGAIGVELVDNTMDLLRDGDWHSVNEFVKKLSVPEEKVKAILRFRELLRIIFQGQAELTF